MGMCFPTPHDTFPSKYALVNLEDNQVQHLASPKDDLPGFFSSERLPWLQHEWWLWMTLARPVADVGNIQAHNPSCGTTLSPVEKLPNELLDEVITHLSDKKDVLAFGLSSAILWRFVRSCVQQDYKRSVGMWAGKKLVFLGKDDHLAHLYHGIPPRFITMHVMLQQTLTNVGREWADALALVKAWNTSSATNLNLRSIEHDLSPTMYPQDRIWVLRNLTTCEFIRSDKLQPSAQQGLGTLSPPPGARRKALFEGAKMASLLKQGAAAFTSKKSNKHRVSGKDPSVTDPKTTPLTFAQIFLVLACYSRVPMIEECFEFAEGRWAGHSFDILTLEAHVAETKPSEWADVSELAVDDVANMRHWVQQLDNTYHKKAAPTEVRTYISEHRRIYHDWEGLDSRLPPGESGWSQKPVQRGLLVNVQVGSDSSRS
jgi:hypothetical protein